MADQGPGNDDAFAAADDNLFFGTLCGKAVKGSQESLSQRAQRGCRQSGAMQIRQRVARFGIGGIKFKGHRQVLFQVLCYSPVALTREHSVF